VLCLKPGPDILIEHKRRRVWIEAIVATDGDPARPDSAVEDHSGKIPDEKIILRYANAINAKHAKYAAYRNSGIISKDDAYVVAINGYPLSYRWAEPEIPRVLKAVFPIGAYEVLIDREKREIVGTRHQFRPAVKKTSGSEVPTQIFLDDHYCDISAVLYSCANGYSNPPMGADFIVVHNPLASQPLPLGMIPSDREYQATTVKDGYELTCHAGTIARSRELARPAIRYSKRILAFLLAGVSAYALSFAADLLFGRFWGFFPDSVWVSIATWSGTFAILLVIAGRLSDSRWVTVLPFGLFGALAFLGAIVGSHRHSYFVAALMLLVAYWRWRMQSRVEG
jgi:hypothetical protein